MSQQDPELDGIASSASQDQYPARILCVEDNDGDFSLVREHLKEAAFARQPELCRAASLKEALHHLQEQTPGIAPFGVVLLDLSLPDSLGPSTYEAIRKAAPETAVIILSGNTDRDLALRMVQIGAQDYLPKDILFGDMLMRSILYSVERQRMRTELNRATHDLHSIQMQLVQAEKLESLGRLAAGVAHEVKNPLGIMQMGLDFLRRPGATPNEDELDVLTHMQEAVTRADEIIHGMLDLSRSNELEMHPCRVNDLVETALRMVNHDLIRRKITIQPDFDEHHLRVRADQGKLHQVLINLLANASQAMPGGGIIKVRTYAAHVDEMRYDEGRRELGRLRRGDEAVIIEIRDHGPGIPEDNVSRIFEPFFTTKPTGEGTGLGLSVAKRIIDLHHGYLQVTNVDNPRGLRVRIVLKEEISSADSPPTDAATRPDDLSTKIHLPSLT